MQNPHIVSFKKIFKETARHENRYTTFSNFVTMAGISIQNSILKCPELEKEYMEIVGRYSKEDAMRMSHLLGEVVMGLEYQFCDFLGSVFMELEISSNHLGQFFTPYHVCNLMSKLTCGDKIDSLKNGAEFITLSEPACGSSAMIIAFAEAMRENDLNPQEQLWVQCIDVDRVAVWMSYIHLSLLGIPGEVIHGNALTMQFNRTYKTPFHYLGLWDIKLRKQDRLNKNRDENLFVAVDDDQPGNEIILPADPLPKIVVPRSSKNPIPQLSLFDFG